jgi:hypothetical protein
MQKSWRVLNQSAWSQGLSPSFNTLLELLLAGLKEESILIHLLSKSYALIGVKLF